MKKKILIINATAGLGHINAAKALEKAILKKYPNMAVVDKDVLEFSNNKLYKKIFSDGYTYISSKLPRVWKWFYNSYNAANTQKVLDWASKLSIDKRLTEYVLETKPDFIISTNPVPSSLIAESKDKYVRDLPLGIVVTDWGVHSSWFARETDYYFVASEKTKKELEKFDIPSEIIYVTGIPIKKVYSKKLPKEPLIEKYGLNKNSMTLLMIGSQMKLKSLEKVANGVLEKNGVNVIVIAGRDKQLQEKLEKSSLKDNKSVKVFGFVDKIEELLNVADVIVSKTGGLITSECMAMGLPMISYKVIPGQEEDNLNFLIERGAGVHAKSIEEIVETVNELSDNPEKLKELQANAESIGKPNAAEDIADIIVEKMKEF